MKDLLLESENWDKVSFGDVGDLEGSIFRKINFLCRKKINADDESSTIQLKKLC